MKIEVDIDVSSGGQARRFARIFRYMSFESCRDHAANDEEAVIFLNSIDKILSEVRKDFHCENSGGKDV
ncbi:MAG: hypothetical protein LUQ18_02255 [Methylococcaceae bacterium]|nr:hypothetical protein [Methylococcaceae bacterium]